MNKIWYLSTCDTNKRIIEELGLKEKGFEFQNIKENSISQKDLETIKQSLDCSYEELFNKRAQKYKLLKDSIRSDKEFKQAILSEYTFLKRPVIQIGDKYFVGNRKKVVEEVKKIL